MREGDKLPKKKETSFKVYIINRVQYIYDCKTIT